MPPTGVIVERGPTLDGIGKYLRDEIVEDRSADRPMSPRSCERRSTDVLVSYLPVGSQKATEFYAEQALEAGCAFVNCIPVFIASNPAWRAAFRGQRAADHRRRHQEPGRRDHRAPHAGQSVPRARRAAGPHLPAQFRRQHRFPEHARARAAGESKKISKTQSVASQLDMPLEPGNIHVGPSDHVPWLTDRKWCYIRMEGTTFGGVPLNCELKLEVWDCPELRRHRHRRRALRQAGAGPRHRRRR